MRRMSLFGQLGAEGLKGLTQEQGTTYLEDLKRKLVCSRFKR